MHPNTDFVSPAPADSTFSKEKLTPRPHGGAAGDTSTIAERQIPAGTRGKWQRERERRVHRMCLGIEKRIAEGQKIERAIRHYARQFRNRHYVCDKTHAIHLGAGTIKRLFYTWRNGGREPAALALHFRSTRRKIPPAQVADFAMAGLAPGVTSMQKAHVKLPQPCGSWHAYRHNVKGQTLAALTKLFTMRRALRYQEIRTRRIVEAFAAERRAA